MHLLLVNPNTSAHITARMERSVRAMLAPGERLTALTAPRGPAVIASRAEAVLAAAGVLELLAAHGDDADAVVLGVSLDCGLDAARTLAAPRPVVGMTEAGVLMSTLVGARFGLLTVGGAMLPLYRELVARQGLGERLAGCAGPDLPAAFAAGGPDVDPALCDALAASAAPLLAQGAESVVLAGAVLCGYAPALADRLGVPVLDGVQCAVQLARAQAGLRLPAARIGSHAPVHGRATSGLDAALARRLARPAAGDPA